MPPIRLKLWSIAVLLLAVLLGGGCFSSTAKTDSQAEIESAEQPLRVTVIDDPDLAKVIEREWTGASQQSVVMTQLDAAEVTDQPLNTDVVIYPSRMLGQMVATRQVIPYPLATETVSSADDLADVRVATEASDYDWDDVLPWLRRNELRWNDQVYGVSLGSPQLLLAYRADWFETWQLKPPTSWTEYQALLPIIQSKLADRPDTWATSEPVKGSWAAPLLLARAASYARHPNQVSTLFQFVSMTPWIDQPPFERALRELLATRDYQSPDLAASPDATMFALLNGKCAMAITWPSSAQPEATGTDSAARFGLAPLPGSSEVYSVAESAWQPRTSGMIESVALFGVAGRIGSVARRSRSIETSSRFLAWLTSKEESARISTASSATTLLRQSQTPVAREWLNLPLVPQARQFVDIVLTNQQQTAGLMLLRIPGQNEYLSSLSRHVEEAWTANRSAKLAGGEPMDEDVARQALRAAVDEWQAITARRGLESQRQFYLESLGLNVN